MRRSRTVVQIKSHRQCWDGVRIDFPHSAASHHNRRGLNIHPRNRGRRRNSSSHCRSQAPPHKAPSQPLHNDLKRQFSPVSQSPRTSQNGAANLLVKQIQVMHTVHRSHTRARKDCPHNAGLKDSLYRPDTQTDKYRCPRRKNSPPHGGKHPSTIFKTHLIRKTKAVLTGAESLGTPPSITTDRPASLRSSAAGQAEIRITSARNSWAFMV